MTRKWRFGYAMLLIIAAAACSSQVIAQDSPARVDDDGLEQIDSRFQAFYSRPGATFGKYRRVAILDCFVDFREGWQRDQNRGKLSSNKVTAEHMARIKEILADEFLDAITEVLEEDGAYEIVNVAAADVLVLRPAILNLDVGAEIFGVQSPLASFSTALSMTLYLELYDSVTSTLIGRAIDSATELDRDRGAVLQILGRWAADIRDTLDENFDGDQ